MAESGRAERADDSLRGLLEFPCDFPIKVMGANGEAFIQAVLEIVRRHVPGFDATRMRMRPSAKGTYLSITCTFRAGSRQQLDALYHELTAHPLVKVVL
jgi:putative lipoic acid-binding regulatory protein